MRVVALIAALLLVPAGASFAHVRSSQGYSDIRGGDGTVLYDLSLESAILDAAAGHGPVADYVLPRVQVFLDGVECDGEVRRTGVASRDGRDHTRMLLAYACPGSPDGAYEIRYGVFADGGVVDDHANVATYRLGGASGTFVFDAGHHELTAVGPWRSLKASGDFTWAGAATDEARRTGPHEIEVEAVDESGARWSERSSYEATRDTPEIEAGADWEQYHGDQQHSGVAADVLAPPLSLAWTHRTPGAILTGSPVVADGVAYVGIRDENDAKESGVHAVELSSGRTLWRFSTPSSVVGTPAIANGMVLVPSLRGTLYAVSARTGRLVWKREVEPGTPPFNQRAYSYYSPALSGDTVYWPYQARYGKASRGLLTALDVETGATRCWPARGTGTSTRSQGASRASRPGLSEPGPLTRS